MNIAQLEYLKELYVCGSFSVAADRLGVTQPALSLQIQKLEEELEFKLIDRSKRPFQFTEEGKLFYEKSLEILKQIEALKQISINISEEVSGNLRVGIIPTLAPYVVPLFIHQLEKTYPALQLEIYEFKTEEIIDKIKMGDIDCGIISTPISATNIAITPLFYERFFAYLSEEHRLFDQNSIDIKSVKEGDIWYLEEGNCFQNQVNSICQLNPQKKNKQQLVYHSNSIESLRRIVEYKSGLTFIPELATINIPADQEELIKEIVPNQPVREISLITAKRFAKERQVNALKEVIKSSIPVRMLQQPKDGIVDTLL
ncbi:hydrogen peroxide-inducible genes activator [Draconibacterium halophilum]|uniref:Hydrogen peroxide-inducible genes activator n=1 Tax=Draconibacterium halophilum TaxID=2706887 RepID=A0A6C0RAM0_9BACT|nr:hydrogen peroxide-inducible genes activator [Draconibacterium halophilum]QIA07668.1 hydrogen peroxide-inducible genes activator [Draconibacterium halophilum]